MTLLSRLVLWTRQGREQPIHLVPFVSFIMICLMASLAHAEATDVTPKNGINAIAFAANGRWIAGAYDNGNIVVVDLERKKQTRYFPNQKGLAVTGVSFMDADKQVLSAGLDGFILFRDASSGGRLRLFDGQAVPVRSLAVSPDGRTVVSGGEDGVIRLWDVESGKIAQQRRVSEDAVTALTVSPAGGTIASLSASGRISLLDINRSLAPTQAANQRDAASTIAFTTDGRTLLSGGADGYVRQWSPKTLANDKSLFLGAPITALSVSPDGRTVAVGTEGSSIILWDPATGGVAGTLGTRLSFIGVLAFSPDGTIIAAGGGDNGELTLLDVGTGEIVQAVRPFPKGQGGDEGIPAAEGPSAASSQSASTASTSGPTSSPSPAAAPAASSAAVAPAALPPNAVTALGLNPTGALIASGLANGKLILWDRATRTQVRPFEGHNNLPVTAVSFTSAGLSSAGRDSVIRAWNVLDGRELYRLQMHEHAVRALVVSNNGQSVAAAGEDLRIGVWGADQKLQSILIGHKDFINALAFSNNNLVLASGSADDTINVWDVKAGKLLRTIRGHTGDVTALTFATNGKTLISASVDKTIRFWDIDTGQQVQILRGPEKPLRALALSSNEKLLVAGGDDPEVFNWDLTTGQMRTTASVLKGRVTAVAVVPDGTTIVSGDEAGEISLFNATSGIRTGLIRTAASPEAQPTNAPGGRP